jgi:hypothetical protein
VDILSGAVPLIGDVRQTGQAQWYQCDGQASFWNAIVQGPNGGPWIDVQVIFSSDADLTAVTEIIDTFAYSG